MGHGDIPLIIDKSTFQSLSVDETMELSHCYRITQTPTMLMEILADIKKNEGSDQVIEKVKSLAHKTCLLHGMFVPTAQTLVRAELRGNPIQMDGRPVVLHGVHHDDPIGGSGIYFDEPPEFATLRRWEDGDFTTDEQILAEQWRTITHKLNIEKWKQRQTQFSSVRDLDSLRRSVNGLLASGSTAQFKMLNQLMDDLRIPPSEQQILGGKWVKFGLPDLRRCAPYTAYCISVFYTFYMGVASNLFGTKDTNRVDLDYLLYFPFTRCFSSGDAFHLKIAPLFMDQDLIIPADILKFDLASLRSQRETRTPEQHALHRQTFGNRPGDDSSSITCRLYNHLFGPPKPEPTPIPRNPEEESALVRRFNEMAERAEVSKRKQREITGDPKTEFPPPPIQPP